MTLSNVTIPSDIRNNFLNAYPITLITNDLQFNILGRVSKSAYNEV